MNLELTVDETGYRKALLIKHLISVVDLYDLESHFDAGTFGQLRRDVERFLAQPEFQSLRDGNIEEAIEVKPPGIRDLLRNLFGPSRQEINLSKQREALIERAEHAENSAFEALAELAEAARERDQVKARLKELESELSVLKSEV